MSLWDYLAQLDARLRVLAAIIVNSSIQQDIDANLEMGFIKGRLVFLDGSVLEFSDIQAFTQNQERGPDHIALCGPGSPAYVGTMGQLQSLLVRPLDQSS